MKKLILVIGGMVVVAAAVAGVVVWRHNGQGKTGGSSHASGAASTSQKNAASGSYKVVSACQAFTLADAKAVLGAAARASSANGSGDTSNSDIAVSTCTYASGNTTQNLHTVTLLARSAKDAAGAASNKAEFTTNKPTGKQDVQGIGDAAFWDAPLSQLNVLKGGNWYIIGNIAGTNVDSGSLSLSQTVFNQIQTKL